LLKVNAIEQKEGYFWCKVKVDNAVEWIPKYVKGGVVLMNKYEQLLDINENRIPTPDETIPFSPAEVWNRAIEAYKASLISTADTLNYHEYIHEDSISRYINLSYEERKDAKHLDVDALLEKGYVENPYEIPVKE
jgi:hypothetical protein